ncbi:hypothetical protein E4O92_06955 [Massilia horti]|uniref:Uncharacterized protein n=2 Tax=Massilia horti TaxID=2562153 RepID=A0A4Y9T2M3_9BURK|nr:hypothetical protein E4O92_06955 [Massilia horti]
MRPTDENQRTSTRPNLMSSGPRRSGEDNILDMLERDSGRGRLGRQPRLAWIAGGSVLSLLLVVALVVLLRENANNAENLRNVYRPTAVPEAATVAEAAARAPAPQAAPVEQAAAIVDMPEPAASVAEVKVEEPPPLVLLTPGAASAAAKTVDQQDAPPTPTPAAKTAAVDAPVVHDEAPPRMSRPIAKPAAKAFAASSTSVQPKAKASAHPPTSPRAKKPVAGAAQTVTEAQVDTDVALISAIILHSNSNAEGCTGADKKCAPHP